VVLSRLAAGYRLAAQVQPGAQSPPAVVAQLVAPFRRVERLQLAGPLPLADLRQLVAVDKPVVAQPRLVERRLLAA
jgi:hypothetical protein